MGRINSRCYVITFVQMVPKNNVNTFTYKTLKKYIKYLINITKYINLGCGLLSVFF